MLKKIDFQSFKTILFVGLLFRLIAAIFSEGYGMHDDHFLTIEASASWANHYDYNHWLPWNQGSESKPEGHSFTYVGLNYLFFAVLKAIGFVNPKGLMIVNRILHALLSTLVIYFGIKITEKIASRKNAVIVGWMLALLWLMPFMSVRNLVEMVAIPFLMWGIWYLIKKDVFSRNNIIMAGFMCGIAISLRYQIGIFSVGIAFYYLVKKSWKEFIFFSLGNLISFSITQGIVDFFIWGYPFAEFWSYVTYNMNQGTQYLPNTNYFMYFYVLFGVLLFPFGILVGIGFFRSYKNSMLLFLPTALFLLFHTFYPNRQERFILSILPFFIILGVIGFEGLKEKKFWNSFWNVSYKIFWGLNIFLVCFFSMVSTKYSRINAMYSLYSESKQNPTVLMEGSGDASISLMPKFYGNKWHASFIEKTVLQKDSIPPAIDYIFFAGKGNLEQRIRFYKAVYPTLQLHKKCDPSLIDKIVHNLNPRNVNEYIEIWKVDKK
jgi:hypothetical protein